MSYLTASWTVKLGAPYLITLVARRRISGGGFIILYKRSRGQEPVAGGAYHGADVGGSLRERNR